MVIRRGGVFPRPELTRVRNSRRKQQKRVVKTIIVSIDSITPGIKRGIAPTTRNIIIDEIKHRTNLYFSDVHNLFGLYHNILKDKLNEQQNKICWEIREQLFSLESHIRRIKYLNYKITNPTSSAEVEPTIHNVYSTELWDSVELFYYRAHRLIKITSNLPELGKINAKGITMVRNWLIEHPEKSVNGSLDQSLSLGVRNGPVLKPSIVSTPSIAIYRDKGLLVNALELKKSLTTTLSIWISQNKAAIKQHVLKFGYPVRTRKMYLKLVES